MDEFDAFLDGHVSAKSAPAPMDEFDAFLDAPSEGNIGVDIGNGVINKTPEGVVMRGPNAAQGKNDRSFFQEAVESNPITSGFVGIGAGLTKAAVGGIQAGAELLGADGVAKAAGDATKRINRNLESDRLGTSGRIGSFVGEVAPYVALPASAATLGGRMALGSVAGGTQGFATAQEESDLGARTDRATMGAALGAAIPAVITGGSKLVGGGIAAVRSASAVDDIAAKELADQGIEVSKATAGGDFVKSYMRKMLAPSTFGGKNVAEAARRVQGQIDSSLDDLISRVGKSASDPYSAGELVGDALEKAGKSFKQAASKMSDDLLTKVDGKALVVADKTLTLVDEIASPLAGSATNKAIQGVASQADDTLRGIVNAVNQDSKAGILNVEMMMRARQDIGSLIKDIPYSDARQGALKRVYGALSEDIKTALGKQSTEALDAFNGFNKFYRTNLIQLKGLEKRYGSTKSAEQVFNAVMGTTKTDTKRLGVLLNNMTPSARDSLKASVLRKMSVPSGGADFSQAGVGTFTRNWNKLPPTSKAIFGNTAEIDKLARNYERVSPLISALPENGFQGGISSADQLIGAASMIVGVFNPMALVAGSLKFGGDALFSRLITNPQAMRAVNRAAVANTPAAAKVALTAMVKLDVNETVRNQLMKLRDSVDDVAKGIIKRELTDPDIQRGSMANPIGAMMNKATTIPTDQASRMARAREMGFDVDNPVYHGTPDATFNEFKPDQFFTSDPSYANKFTTSSSASSSMYGVKDKAPAVIPTFVKTKNVFDTRKPEHAKILKDMFEGKFGEGKLTPRGLPDWVEGRDIAEFLREQLPKMEFDSILVDEGIDAAGARPIAKIVFDPKNIRSVNAQFDPSKADSANLLAARPESTVAAVGLAGGLGAANIGSGIVNEANNLDDKREQLEREGMKLNDTKNDISFSQAPARGAPQLPSSQPIITTSPERLPASQGVSPDIIDRIIMIESGGNPNAKAKTSSALGLGQFTTKTWLSLVEQKRPDLFDGRTKGQVLALRRDPDLSREMLGELMGQNKRILERKGVPITDASVYLAHFMGPSSAAKLLEANPNQPVAGIVGKAAVDANRSILAGKKVKDVIGWAERKVKNAKSS